MVAVQLTMLVAGCQQPAQPEGPTASRLADDEDLEQLWQTSLAVLQKMDFRPDRQDRAIGVITTSPTTSMQWYEPWRQDVATGYALLEASIHSIQRVVTVRFVKGDSWSMQVQVDVFRLSRPSAQITTASSVLHGFSGVLPTTEANVADSPVSEHWVHVGRDGPLEERILNRILNEAGAAWVQDSVE
ncbi:MAG: hypothetical protein KF841_11850 [Phycisphaerae bacterium]|nr:hypothetical protein [Phycisphaerae bacterium]